LVAKRAGCEVLKGLLKMSAFVESYSPSPPSVPVSAIKVQVVEETVEDRLADGRSVPIPNPKTSSEHAGR